MSEKDLIVTEQFMKELNYLPFVVIAGSDFLHWWISRRVHLATSLL